ncbi:MAG: heme-binding protein [Gammaproteobacteria bacterium]|jgi:uncharacterized protein GlcG (DUF336 family)
MNKKMLMTIIAVNLLISNPIWAEQDQPTVVDIKRMSLDVALRIGKAAIAQCRKEGVQVAVTVVDRGGHPQVVLRDVLAQDLTLRISKMKAYTAMSFNSPTSQLEGRFKSPFSIGKVEGLVMSAGGVPVQASGNIIGGVGVSGAPSGEIDEKCAKAGVDAVRDDLEMATM